MYATIILFDYLNIIVILCTIYLCLIKIHTYIHVHVAHSSDRLYSDTKLGTMYQHVAHSSDRLYRVIPNWEQCINMWHIVVLHYTE